MREPKDAPHTLHIHLFENPVEILGEDGNVVGLRTERMELDGTGHVQGTGKFTEWPVQAVYRAVGYRSEAITAVPFDHGTAVIPNDGGHVVDPAGEIVPGVYVTGWIKRGPVGLIGNTKSDAKETTDMLIADALAGRLIPWFAVSAALLCLVGLWLSFWEAPTDFQQGEVYRIIFIHVPAAWMAMFIYLVMAIYAILNLGFRTRMSAMMIAALAPTGALWAAIALWTGSLWGKPTWGTYWAWDARMTSTLILLFLYFGYLALTNAIEDRNRADRAGSILVLVGSINVPIIYFSVNLWNTLHQGSSVNPAARRWPR